MKDIEILEEFAKEYKDTGYFGIIKAKQIQILDNILKERQADKEKIKELEAINKKLEARKYIYNAETGEVTAIPIDNNYISKAKIKAKIEELKQKKYILSSRESEIEILQSLLEDGGVNL